MIVKKTRNTFQQNELDFMTKRSFPKILLAWRTYEEEGQTAFSTMRFAATIPTIENNRGNAIQPNANNHSFRLAIFMGSATLVKTASDCPETLLIDGGGYQFRLYCNLSQEKKEYGQKILSEFPRNFLSATEFD
jgi:hypothetical protein